MKIEVPKKDEIIDNDDSLLIEVPEFEEEIEDEQIEVNFENHTVSQKQIPGPQGEKGEDGKDGKTPTDKEILSIVKPHLPKEKDIVDKVLKKIPKPKDGNKGEKGDKGDKGDTLRFAELTPYEKQILTGPQGSNGVGVPRGGTANQILSKKSGSDFDTEWVNGGSGGGAVDSVNGQTGVVVLDTDDINDSATNRYTNDTDITRLANTSGNNNGDQVGDGVTITGAGTVGDPFVAVGGGSGTVTSVAVSGSDGIEVDSGSPITTNGTIALGINKTSLLSHINVEDGAEVNNISDANATDLTDGGETTLHTHDSRYYTESETDTLLGGKVTGNTAITGATKTKITYDTKGLVTAGTDATTADIADSTDRRYVTDAQQTVIGNTSGTNTGDNATNTQYSGLAASKQDTLVSGTNIKTVNSTSLLGSGDVAVATTAQGALADSALQAANISDTAYDATTWNGVTTIAPSKNAVRDKIETMDTAISLNTAKVTNATHTGDIAGATSTTAQPAIITGKAPATVASGDLVLIADINDANALKQVTAQSIADLGGGGVTDGDKGDITVSGGGATWTIDNDAVTYAKMQNVVGNNVLLGNNAGAGGVVDELTASEVRTIINVENGADVTDTANVTSAGALMDSEVADLTAIKTLLAPDNTTISAFGATLVDDADAATARTTLGLGTLATQSGTFSGTSSGTNTGDQTSVSGNSGTATALQNARTIGTATGDVTSAGSSFNGTANNTNAYTLATVNSNVGSFTNANITVNAKGLVTAAANGSGGGLTWNEVTGTSQSASINNGYIANNAGLVTVTIPTTAAVGSVVRIAGKGAGGWRVAQNASEQIHFGNQSTTVGTGGYIEFTHRRDAVELVCVVADTEWMVLSSIGNITIV